MTSKQKQQVLLVFEGPTDERQFAHLDKTFFKLLNSGKYKVVEFKTSIYELYEPLINQKTYDSLPALLFDEHKLPIPLEGKRPQDVFSLIYLVFDFDPNYHLYSEEKIKALQAYFSDETRNGLLYINYPMVEALFDFRKNENVFSLNKTVSAKICSSASYKKFVKNKTAFKSEKSKHCFCYLPPKDFSKVSLLSKQRYFEILNQENNEKWTMTNIKGLLEKEISATHDGVVYPLSCFPFMALDYNADSAISLWNNVLPINSKKG